MKTLFPYDSQKFWLLFLSPRRGINDMSVASTVPDYGSFKQGNMLNSTEASILILFLKLLMTRDGKSLRIVPINDQRRED